MRATGKFVFKCLEEKEGGEFVNEKGQKIQFPSSYHLTVDEIKDGVIKERKLKFPKTNETLHSKLDKLSPYDKINLVCEVELYNSTAKVIPVDIVDSNNK